MQNDIQHGGDLASLSARAQCDPAQILDLSVNLNPLGPPLGAFEEYFKSFEELCRYPEPRAESLVALLSKIHHRPADEIMAGNGSNELIRLLPQAVKPPRAVIVTPGYLEYAKACEAAGITTVYFTLSKEKDFRLDCTQLTTQLQPGDLAMLGAPNNPGGQMPDQAALLNLIETRPDCTFLLDEAFIDFAGPQFSLIGMRLPNLVVSRSFTKFYALPGLRMGAMFGPETIISKIKQLQGVWTMSVPAISMAKFLLSAPEAYAVESREFTATLRTNLTEALQQLPGLKVYPSVANYVLVETEKPDLSQELLTKHKIAVRDCANYPGLDQHFIRIAVCDNAKQDRLLDAMTDILKHKPAKARKRPTPALMLQGTCSNAGKSVLTAAFCRILLQDGYSVAPFKAQNMALNSYVTHDGLEIGRAQAFQAEACRLDPDVRMNPVLLKPNSDTGSQIILRGKPVGNLDARNFRETKARFWETIKDCYDSLADGYGVMVLEGAGSPAEVNLKQNDVVNMNMAAYARAQVLLTGDIDRGGVYAAFAGSYATFTLKERELLAGFVINKFRGDAGLLKDAHTWVENLTGKPVLGVLDYLKDLRLPEEDSVNHGLLYNQTKQEPALDAALIILPHIANFTDFDPLLLEPDVGIRKVRNVLELGTPDIIILPGTKNTIHDTVWLRENGLETAVKQAYDDGAWLIGICGGLQMLGQSISDPYGIESGELQEIDGLGLLPLTTVMEQNKILCQCKAVRQKDNAPLRGYEIHHGQTRFEGTGFDMQIRNDGTPLGLEGQRIFASYLHGVFDDDRFRRNFINEIRSAKGWPELSGVTAVYETEESLNRLADHVRERIDMDNIYKLLNL